LDAVREWTIGSAYTLPQMNKPNIKLEINLVLLDLIIIFLNCLQSPHD